MSTTDVMDVDHDAARPVPNHDGARPTTDHNDAARPMKRQRSPEPVLPLQVLLLSLPNLLLHPPNHKFYHKSLYLSRLAFHRCLMLQNLDADVECKIWTSLAEAGIRMGLGVEGIEHEVEKAITKALLIAQHHPALRPYRVHLTLLSARLAQHQLNFKFAQNTLRRQITSFLSPQDAPHLVYMSHLGYISSLSVPDAGGVLLPTAKSLGAIQDLHTLGTSRGHADIVKLAAALRVHALLQMGSMDMVQDALGHAQQLLSFPDDKTMTEAAATFAHAPRSKNETAFLVYTLVMGAVYYTHIGDAASTEARTKVLHEMLDGNALSAFGPHGILEVWFPGSHPLYVRTAHPRILFTTAFLVTAIAKRDPVGRKPKRKVFAAEGLVVVERELKKEPSFPLWASEADFYEHRSRLQKLKADLMCEIIGVCIMRSEFGEAEKTMSELIAHTRNEQLFNYYSARITLLQAQLSHALGHPERALQCYQVAAYLSRKRDPSRPLRANDEDEGVEDQWTHAAASAGELWVRIGLLRSEMAAIIAYGEAVDSAREVYFKQQEVALRHMADDVIRACAGLGGALGAISCVLEACLTSEFLKAKQHLKDALKIVSSSNDNHLRALILALIASQYLTTSMEHAEAMLATAEQLAAGLGAQPRSSTVEKNGGTPTQRSNPGKTGDGVGNAPLRLWIGERMLELKRRAGDEVAARNQEMLNVKLRIAVQKIEQRKSVFGPVPVPVPVDQSFSKLGIDDFVYGPP
ncbi:hypothetical protein CC1G_10108 [Coprinopsis cinerea okayama7|uniref:Uncharacterized protein n=1 Tax=Coprinopsis cinerea (strain Okayama-7 / 130 / ATCC MYA-4618 / FGSC 9003) TaxID=240176 RepID=A8N405_COPC7|nr:hypothetical protein CC1G_10108 [Coprinopsis cinerea okayama7\|eukprot:XP_001829578.1 hypothetical protein CC1G_10108 [Coprinopsis cinerea okayama7\